MRDRIRKPMLNEKSHSFLWMGFGGIVGFIAVYFLFSWLDVNSSIGSKGTSVFLSIHKDLVHGITEDKLKVSEYQVGDVPEMFEYPASQTPVRVSDVPVKIPDNWAESLDKRSSPPFIKNGQPVQKGTKPKIALVISSVGPDKDILKEILRKLPKEITLSFACYTSHLGQWIENARIKGHEVLMDLPLETMEYPQLNSGPYTLRVNVNPLDNIEKLNKILGKGEGMIVGVSGVMGSGFLESFRDILPILETLKTAGYMFLDAMSSPPSVVPRIAVQLTLPFAQNNQFLDDELSKSLILKNLVNLERIAQKGGVAVGVGHANGLTVELVATWVEELEGKGIDLVPITDVLQ